MTMGKSQRPTTRVATGTIPVLFERMLADLSAQFINLAPAEVDDAIDTALQRIARILGADRSNLIRFEADEAHVTHSGALNGVPRSLASRIESRFPWASGRLRQGHPVVVRSLDALPGDASIDLASWRALGVQSHLSVPLRVGGRIEGALAFGCLRTAHDWPEQIVERIGVLADVFANALDHKRAQLALDTALRVEQLVSRILAEMLTTSRDERSSTIQSGLGAVARAFGAERAALLERVADGDEIAVTHRWHAEGMPERADSPDSSGLPWIRGRLLANQTVHFARHADLPMEAASDLPALRDLGIRSAIMVPFAISGRTIGAISLASSREDREWPSELPPRMRLLGEVFATSLAQRAAERREQEAQAQAAHAARVGTMGMFAASLIHELTQPLAASLANAENAADLLRTPDPDIDELRAAVDDIVADDRRVRDLIQQLRRFLRRGQSERTDIDVGELVRDNVAILAGVAAERGIALTHDIAAGLPGLTGDRVQLQQVMLNLLLNALDAVESGGAASRRVSILARAADGEVGIEVSDNGPGMDEALAARVFQPFFTTKPDGMGLGLSISRSIVVAHGGRILVQSAPGRGTTFRVQLPSRPPAPSKPAPPRATADLTGTVFVVDDDPSMRRALQRQLRDAGHTVECFDSAQALLDRMPQADGACIVSDVRMPEQSGLDLQASLVASKRDVPIVFISGHGDVPTTVQALKLGAVGFVVKPFTKHEILDAVGEALARGRAVTDERRRLGMLRTRHSSLTPREREVFDLVASGMLNKLIADRLGTAEATVKIHRGRVMEKMEAKSVADLVRMAQALAPAIGGPG